MTELEFTREVIKWAQALGWQVAHFRPAQRKGQWMTAMLGNAGYPDLTLVRDRVIFAELKLPGNRPSVAQQRWSIHLANAHAEQYLWHPADLPEIIKILRHRT